jgi:hypothetical protein
MEPAFRRRLIPFFAASPLFFPVVRELLVFPFPRTDFFRPCLLPLATILPSLEKILDLGQFFPDRKRISRFGDAEKRRLENIFPPFSLITAGKTS